MALLLGVVGIYGVIAYSVSQRTREIGIRIALGAQLRTVIGMFVRQGMLLTGIGLVVGFLVSLVVMRLMSTLLFGVESIDPPTYIAVSCALATIAFLLSARATGSGSRSGRSLADRVDKQKIQVAPPIVIINCPLQQRQGAIQSRSIFLPVSYSALVRTS